MSTHSMTVARALAEGAACLAGADADCGNSGWSGKQEAALLLAEALGTSRSRLPLLDREEIAPDVLDHYRSHITRRASGEPAAYILGLREFRGLDFTVSPAVLIPRPDTETLVEAALEWIDKHTDTVNDSKVKAGVIRSVNPPPSPIVLDLCTGSGAVAVSLKHERPAAGIWASDISPAALAIARANAARLLGERGDTENTAITFIESDLFSAFQPELHGAFNLIVTNPPYVERGAIPGLQQEVRREPRIALDGGEDGLALIRRIIAEAPRWLAPGGGILIEADPAQMVRIAALFEENGFESIKQYRDLTGRERVSGARLGTDP